MCQSIDKCDMYVKMKRNFLNLLTRLLYRVIIPNMVITTDTEMDLMTVNEVASMLGIHPLTVRRKLNTKKIRAWKVDNLWRIPKSEVFRYLEDSTAKAFRDKES